MKNSASVQSVRYETCMTSKTSFFEVAMRFVARLRDVGDDSAFKIVQKFARNRVNLLNFSQTLSEFDALRIQKSSGVHFARF